MNHAFYQARHIRNNCILSARYLHHLVCYRAALALLTAVPPELCTLFVGAPVGAQHVGRLVESCPRDALTFQVKLSVQVRRFDQGSGAAVICCCCRMQRRRSLNLVPSADACRHAATWGSLCQLSYTNHTCSACSQRSFQPCPADIMCTG